MLSSMPLRPQDPRSILITGGSSGIGEALARRYAQPGVHLFLCGRDRDRLDAVARACQAAGAEVSTTLLDITDRERTETWIREAHADRPLDLVIANAGISAGTTTAAGPGEAAQQVRDIFDINLSGTLNTMQPAIALMAESGGGQIALMSSIASFRGFPSAPAYSASKAAVRFYGEAMRGALARHGIAVSVICPGFVRSRITAANRFPMPFFMEAEPAARIIQRGLARNQALIAFPWPMRIAAGLLTGLPSGLASRLLAYLPGKG